MKTFFMLAVVGGLLVGCAAHPTKPAKLAAPGSGIDITAPITNTDECATQMHDLCGSLLMYYSTHRALPERMDQLQQMSGFEGAVVCPVSSLAYVYDARGVSAGESGSRVVLWDATPVHEGMRWGISINDPAGNAPLVAKVVALPESRFNPPQ